MKNIFFTLVAGIFALGLGVAEASVEQLQKELDNLNAEIDKAKEQVVYRQEVYEKNKTPVNSDSVRKWVERRDLLIRMKNPLVEKLKAAQRGEGSPPPLKPRDDQGLKDAGDGKPPAVPPREPDAPRMGSNLQDDIRKGVKLKKTDGPVKRQFDTQEKAFKAGLEKMRKGGGKQADPNDVEPSPVGDDEWGDGN